MPRLIIKVKADFYMLIIKLVDIREIFKIVRMTSPFLAIFNLILLQKMTIKRQMLSFKAVVLNLMIFNKLLSSKIQI